MLEEYNARYSDGGLSQRGKTDMEEAVKRNTSKTSHLDKEMQVLEENP